MAKTTMKFLTWCWACGAHAYAKAYKLAKPCSGKLTEQGRLAVQRIRVGRAPRKVLGALLYGLDQNYSMFLWASGPHNDDADDDDDDQNYSMLLWASGPHNDDADEADYIVFCETFSKGSHMF